MNDIKPKSVFEMLTERNIRFTFRGNGTNYYANCINSTAEPVTGTYEEAMSYFNEVLNYDKSASGDGGEGF